MKKILIVDDVELLRDVYKKYLSASHAEVFTAVDGEEALELARRERPDLIVMDRYMPRMDGLACCMAIKGDAAISHIPVIMTTNASQEDDADEYSRSGVCDILVKPIEEKTFLDTVVKYLPEIDRRTTRVKETLDIKILSDGSRHEAMTENISVGGAFAVAELDVSVNEELSFSFLLPGKEVPIEVLGRIVWLRKGSGPPGFGIEFIKVVGKGVPLLRAGELRAFIRSKIED